MPLVPVASSPTYQGADPPPGQNQQQLVFDFTKRKRWADLLVSELTEAIMLILSRTGQVWYCGPAVEELLGWKDEEVTDTNVCDIMNEDDRATFQRQFNESIQNRTDLLAYARLQCKTAKDLYPNVPAPQPVGLVQPMEDKASPKEVLFEIKGYPHFVASRDVAPGMGAFSANEACATNSMSRGASDGSGSDDSFKCFFAMAKPYPSRNTAMLNTFLELKMENERLQARLRAAKARAESLNISTTPSTMQRTISVASSVPSQPHSSYPAPVRSFPYAFPTAAQPSNDETPTYIPYEASGSGTQAGPSQSQQGGDDHENVSSEQPRKKPKRIVASDMYVCTQCGRTDSPEWRKGPQGPKTLCNACGLRWAKSNRGAKEAPTTTTPSTTSANKSNQHAFSVAHTSSSGNSQSTTSPITAGNAGSGAGAGLGAPFMGSGFDQMSNMHIDHTRLQR